MRNEKVTETRLLGSIVLFHGPFWLRHQTLATYHMQYSLSVRQHEHGLFAPQNNQLSGDSDHSASGNIESAY